MPTISVEAATAEFARFTDCMDLDVDEKSMTDEDKVDFAQLKRDFIKNDTKGIVTVNEEGEPTVHFQRPPSTDEEDQRVVFYEPDGAAFLALDKGKKNADRVV